MLMIAIQGGLVLDSWRYYVSHSRFQYCGDRQRVSHLRRAVRRYFCSAKEMGLTWWTD